MRQNWNNFRAEKSCSILIERAFCWPFEVYFSSSFLLTWRVSSSGIVWPFEKIAFEVKITLDPMRSLNGSDGKMQLHMQQRREDSGNGEQVVVSNSPIENHLPEGEFLLSPCRSSKMLLFIHSLQIQLLLSLLSFPLPNRLFFL